CAATGEPLEYFDFW
nr:immunoglobulin heavy chain junction region [Macaca mulatta]MOX62934.1 immunoglobulin heavy chain junction region [Macaca mulatta]MOX63115.1 immunoglobulin heavy chain junction region [Macaca mulatta]MOX63370.1 immunoglobulin heavy chain junction region [Macaca mulatta]MOX63759.1 immunoglobulin heavy chain junction region [Macaca mulatta]